MAEEQQQQQQQQEGEGLTYDSALQDQNLIGSMYYALQGLGEKNIPYDPKTILDTFLTKKRYFETNIMSTANTALDVKDMDEDTKKMYAYALQRAEELPDFYEKGGAPAGKALADYALAGVTDPTNLLSVVAGFFTAGAGTAGVQAGRTAAQQGVKELLKAKIKSAVSQEALKSLAVEGTIAAAGGAGQNYIKQETEQDLGLRDEKDPTEMVLQGALEGTLSPLAGVVANIMGSVAVKSTKDLIDRVPAAEQAISWTKRNFLPAAGVDEGTVRIAERSNGQLVPLNERALEVQEKFNDSVTKTFGKEPDKPTIEMLNKALEGDQTAVSNLTRVSPETANILNDVWTIRDEATQYGTLSNLSQQAKGIFANNSNYIRNVPEAYYVFERKPFNKFVEQNPTVLTRLEQAVMQDATQPPEQRYFREISDKFIDKNGNIPAGITPDDIKKIIREEAERMYQPTRKFRSEVAPLGPKQQVPDVVKEIIGYNNKPALRIADTVNGIVTTAARSNLAADIGAHAVDAGKGVMAPDLATARARLGGKEVVPLVGGFDDKFKPLEKQVSPVKLPLEYVDPRVRNYYVTKEYADQLKTLFNDTPFMSGTMNDNGALGQAYKSVMTIQNLAKAGKTVYSPMAHIRNMLGAAGYTWTSGNARGLVDSLRELTKFSAPAQRAAWDRFEALGLKGSNIDLNQIMRRLGDISGVADDRALSKVLYLGKAGKAARKAYGMTDDLAKFGVFVNEERKSKKIFDKMSPAEKQAKLADFRRSNNRPNATYTDVIAEDAARKVAAITPIYDRIPAIFEKTRSIPVVGSFVAYPAERLRNVYNILKLSTDELREGFRTGNTELTKAGMARLAQFYTAQGALYTAAYAANEMIGASDVVDSLRNSLLPDYQKDHPILITGKNKDGYYKMIDLGYINPDQYILDVIAPIMIKASNGKDVSKDIDKALAKAAGKIVEPYISKTLVLQAAEDLAGVAKGDMSKLDNLVKTLEPGVVKMARDMAADSGALDRMGNLGSEFDRFINPRRFGEQKDRADDFMDFMRKSGLVFPGMREEVIDPRKAIGFALNNLKKNTENSWSQYRKELGATLADPTAQFDPEKLLKKYDEAMRDQFVFQQGVKKLYDDAKNVVPEDKVKDLFKSFDLRGVAPSKRDQIAITSGEAKPLRISQDNKFWVDLNKSYVDKTGQSNWEILRPLRQKFVEIERQYMNKDLKKEAPQLNINKGNE